MIRRALLIFFGLWVGFSAPPLWALDIPISPTGRVSDYAGVLSKDDIDSIGNFLRGVEDSTSNQIAVVIFPSLDGESIEDVSHRIAEMWKLGQKERNNGVLLAVFMKERQTRIEVGYGLEGAVTDAESSEILRNVVMPRFKEGAFATGISEAVRAISVASAGEYTGAGSISEKADTEVIAYFAVQAVIAGMFGFIHILIGGVVGALGFVIVSIFLGYGMGVTFVLGVVGFMVGCVMRFVIEAWASSRGFSTGGSSSGGTFSGGGGSFGGGGASGRW